MTETENTWHGIDNWGDEFDIVDIPVGKPRMTWTIEDLTKYPSADREGTAELVDILCMTEEVHYSLEQNADRNRKYGKCVECGDWWPCRPFESARYAATEWLVNASNAIMRRNGLIGPALPVGGKAPAPDIPMLECYWCIGDCEGVSEEEMARLLAVHELMKCRSIMDNVGGPEIVLDHTLRTAVMVEFDGHTASNGLGGASTNGHLPPAGD